MILLTWWFRAVGGLYLLLGVGFVPPLNALRLPLMLPGFDAPVGGVAHRGLLDYSFMFGLDLLVIGAYLLHAARDPQRHLPLVGLVVALELVRGVADDLYMLARGYPPAAYAAFIAMHLVVVATGLAASQRARRDASRARPGSPPPA